MGDSVAIQILDTTVAQWLPLTTFSGKFQGRMAGQTSIILRRFHSSVMIEESFPLIVWIVASDYDFSSTSHQIGLSVNIDKFYSDLSGMRINAGIPSRPIYGPQIDTARLDWFICQSPVIAAPLFRDLTPSHAAIFTPLEAGIVTIVPGRISSKVFYHREDTALISLKVLSGSDTLYSAQPFSYITSDCCVGMRGNVDGSSDVDIADLTFLVFWLFSGGIPLPCFLEADVNSDLNVDIADLTMIVDYLFVSFAPLDSCPNE